MALLASIAAACGGPAPTPSPAIAPTPEPSPSASVVAAIPLDVRFRGRVNCNIGFSYYCSPSLSVLEAGSDVPDTFRPASTDPWWNTRGDDMQNVNARTWTLGRGSPAVDPGPRLLVISLIGMSDVASYNPDGSIASDLVARCSAEIEVGAEEVAVGVLVRFESEPDTTRATCTIEVDPD